MHKVSAKTIMDDHGRTAQWRSDSTKVLWTEGAALLDDCLRAASPWPGQPASPVAWRLDWRLASARAKGIDLEEEARSNIPGPGRDR